MKALALLTDGKPSIKLFMTNRNIGITNLPVVKRHLVVAKRLQYEDTLLKVIYLSLNTIYMQVFC